MSFSVTINGHVGTKEAEREIVESLRQWVKEQETGVEYAVVVTSYRGRVNLKENAQEVTAEELRIKQLETELEGLKENRSAADKEADDEEEDKVDENKKDATKKAVPSLKDAQSKK